MEITVTKEMECALNLILNTNENIFITGKAGTGKTTFLKYLTNNCKKQYIITAPTGIAAINAGGATLHSVFQLPFGPIDIDDMRFCRLQKSKADVLSKLEVLFIDEISMVRPDVIDAVDMTLQLVRKNKSPFGGVQVVMFGDMYQLPPVVTKDEKKVLERWYKDYYFFNADVWSETSFQVIELNKIFRQSDDSFVNILNKIRNYSITCDDLDILRDLRDKQKSEVYTEESIHICTHKNKVAEINNSMLGEATHTYKATLNGNFSESSMPCDNELKLRIGARIMCLVNDYVKGCFNGMLGVVTNLTDKVVVAKMDDGQEIQFEPYTWSNKKYTYNEEQDKIIGEDVGNCSQIPLTLAWAITIHKSQGLTFNNVVLHIARTFCPGQLYVALSRCRSIEGIVLDSYITKRMIMPSYALQEFEESYRNNNNVFVSHLIK